MNNGLGAYQVIITVILCQRSKFYIIQYILVHTCGYIPFTCVFVMIIVMISLVCIYTYQSRVCSAVNEIVPPQIIRRV